MAKRTPPGESESPRKSRPKQPDQLKGRANPELMRRFRATCTAHAVSQSESLDRIVSWYCDQHRSTQMMVLGTTPAEMAPAVANHTIRAIVEWAVQTWKDGNPDVHSPLANADERDRLRDIAGCFNIAVPWDIEPDDADSDIRVVGPTRPSPLGPGATEHEVTFYPRTERRPKS